MLFALKFEFGIGICVTKQVRKCNPVVAEISEIVNIMSWGLILN